MDPHIMSSLVILLLIACGVASLAQWLKQPYTIILVLTGILVALIHLIPQIHLSHDIIFTLVLPPLLFYGAMHMDLEHLKNNWKSISLLAIPGVVCSTFLIGFLLSQFTPLPFIYALLFGALITPTDPISVLAILKRVGAPQRLRTILEGESLFNDGTGVVVFSVILGLISGHDHFDPGATFLKFLWITGGGTVIGIVVGLVVYRILKKINDHLHEIMVTIALTFGTPLLAEHFHFSGIIAIVVAGLIIGNYGKVYSMSLKAREALETFWEVIDFLINSLLFLAIGVELQVMNVSLFLSMWPLMGITIFSILLARCIVVYPVVFVKNCFPGEGIPWPWAHVMFWGGLRGSISLALVLGLPHDFLHRELFLSLSFSVILFTLIVQGLTMKPLVEVLGLSKRG